MQCVFDEQKANFDHFNKLKNLNFEHHSQDFKYLLGQRQDGASIQEGTRDYMLTF